jgi:hypothetical protein
VLDKGINKGIDKGIGRAHEEGPSSRAFEEASSLLGGPLLLLLAASIDKGIDKNIDMSRTCCGGRPYSAPTFKSLAPPPQPDSSSSASMAHIEDLKSFATIAMQMRVQESR